MAINRAVRAPAPAARMRRSRPTVVSRRGLPVILVMVTGMACALIAACGGDPALPATAAPIPFTPVVAPTAVPITMPAVASPRMAEATGANGHVPATLALSAPYAPTDAAPASRAAIAPTMARPGATPTTPAIPVARAMGAVGGGGATRSACEVITKADVEAVLGVPVVMPPTGVPGALAPSNGAGAPDDGASICIYVGQGKGNEGVMVSLGQPNPNDPAGTHPLTQASKGTALKPLGGIGDEAVTDGRHIVITRKHGYQLAVIV